MAAAVTAIVVVSFLFFFHAALWPLTVTMASVGSRVGAVLAPGEHAHTASP